MGFALSLLLWGLTSQALSQCRTLEECNLAIAKLAGLTQILEEDRVGVLRQRDILEAQNTQLRARVDDYARNIDGILAAQAVLRADVTSQFAEIRAAQDRRFDELQQAVGKRTPVWRTVLEWGLSATTLVLAAKK